jgi:hypothetical protein
MTFMRARYRFAVALATGRVSARHRGSGERARVTHTAPPAGGTRVRVRLLAGFTHPPPPQSGVPPSVTSVSMSPSRVRSVVS